MEKKGLNEYNLLDNLVCYNFKIKISNPSIMINVLKYGLILVLLLSFQNLIFANDKITLQQAVESGKIRLKAKGNGGFMHKSLNLNLKNNTAENQVIIIPAGQTFRCLDEGAQNLMATEEIEVILASYATKILDLYTMCIESSDHSPSKGDGFEISEMATGGLLKLVNFISKNNYRNSTAQSAVWAITNRRPIQEIYGVDIDMVTEIAQIVSETTGQAMPKITTPKPHHIVSVKTGFQYHAPEELQNVTLAFYDQDGNQVKQIFEKRTIHKGLHRYTVGLNQVAPKGSKYVLRLIQNKQILDEKTVDEFMAFEPLKEKTTPMVLRYESKQNYPNAVLAVYDEKGKLIENLARKNLKSNVQYEHKITFRHAQPLGSKLFYRISSAGGQKIAETTYTISVSDEQPKSYPMKKVASKFSFRAPKDMTNSSLQIYNEEGKVIRKIFTTKYFQEGTGSSLEFSFQHQEGSGAKFYVRFQDNDGEIIKEKEIVSP